MTIYYVFFFFFTLIRILSHDFELFILIIIIMIFLKLFHLQLTQMGFHMNTILFLFYYQNCKMVPIDWLYYEALTNNKELFIFKWYLTI